jgi:chemotaxis signal transduction protein
MQVAKQKESIKTTIRRFSTFRISKRLYGVDIQDVKEINTEINFTPIFHAPREVKGYINIRGQVHLLLDLRLIFGFEAKEIDKSSRVVIFMPEVGDPCGILIDSIDDVVTVDDKLIENRRQNKEAHEGSDRRGIDIGEGVCKLENELLIILNARKLLNNIGKFDSLC